MSDLTSMQSLKIAVEALTTIKEHITSCDSRYQILQKSQDVIFTELRSQNLRWITVLGSIVATLLAVSGYLFIKLMGW